MVFRLLENPFVSQKIESRHFFTHACQEKLSSRFLTLREMSPPPPTPPQRMFFSKIFSPPAERGWGENYGSLFFDDLYLSFLI